MRKNPFKCAIAFTTLLMFFGLVTAQTTYFVSNNGDDSNDGLSWATAKATINGAMALVTAPNNDSVFVAVGTYPACTVKNGTHVYGGFAGTETYLYERQPLTFGIAADSSCSVINAQHNSNYAVSINGYLTYNNTTYCRRNTFDGFYVTGGNHYGIYDVANSTHIISNCTVTDNAGGLFLGMSYSNSYYNATFEVSDCKISGNTSNGGVYMSSGSQSYGATYEFDDCVITGNTGSLCGGMRFNAGYTLPYSTVVVNHCDITKNTASGLNAKAGGILTQVNDFIYTPTRNEWQILNSRIIDNTVYSTATSASAENSRPYIAGGISVFTHPTHIIGCVIANNSAISTEGIDVTGGVVTYSYVTSSGPSSGNPVGRMYMTNCVVANNLAQTTHTNGTGGIRTTSAATVKNTVIWNNRCGNASQNMRWSTNYTHPYTYCACPSVSTSDFAADSTNIVLDTANLPQFVAPSSMVGATTIATDLSNLVADWHVLPNSPLIDAGDPNTAFITYLPATDMDGNPRIGNNRADIGAYELSNTTYDQSISWTQDLTVSVQDGALTLNATATSGLPVTYTCSNESIATINGNVLTPHCEGYAIVTASQSGNTTWNAAAPVSKILSVSDNGADLIVQEILWDQDLTLPLSETPVVLAAAATSGLPVQFACSDENVATINGNILTMHNVGLAIITASQPGNDQYMAAQPVMKILNVTPVGIPDHAVNPVNVWPNPTTGMVNIQCSKNDALTGMVKIHVYDAFGRLLRTSVGIGANNHSPLQMDANGSSEQTQIDLSPFAPGVYFIKVVSDDNIMAVKKVVKQ